MDDVKQYTLFIQLWDRTGPYSSFGGAEHGGFAGIAATNAIAIEYPRDGAGCARPRVRAKSRTVTFQKIQAGQANAMICLDLLVVIQWGHLHLRILQELLVLHFTFRFAILLIKHKK